MAKYPEIPGGKPLAPERRTWRRRITRHLPRLSILVMTAMLIGVVLWPYVVISVPTGEVGVLWYRLIGFDPYCMCLVRGTVLDPREIREEGLHLIAPWNKLFLYDLRLESTTQTYNAISKDGVSMSVQVNVRFQLQHHSVGVLHKFIGPDYFATVVSPEIGSQTRQVISHYTAQEVYTSREAIQDEIRDNGQKSLGASLNKLVQPEAMEQPDPKHYNDFLQNSIQILDTLVLSIELPPAIVAAINRQTEQFYQIQEYKFRVEREAQESKRKQIEANGIAAFQQTVSQGISDSYLRWRGIEATLALAQSPNAKIVIIGTNKDGLPIILGNVDTPAAPNPAPQPGASAPPPPPGAPPGPKDRMPTGALSTPPEAEPTAGDTPPATDPAPANTDKSAGSSGPHGLSDLQALLSRLSGALRSSESAPPPGTATQPKE
jgi:regulator of protease activity HflC (stomatin/prohibitin superfamily)